jgi:hypothetical protein
VINQTAAVISRASAMAARMTARRTSETVSTSLVSGKIRYIS